MKIALKIAKKALPSVIIYFIIFLGMMVAFSFMAGDETEKAYQATELVIRVEDKDNSTLSKTLTQYLGKENEVNPEYEDALLSDLLFYGLVDYVVYVEEGFEEQFLAGEPGGIEKQSTKPNRAFVDQKIEMFFRYVRGELALGNGIEEACDNVLREMQKSARTEVLSGQKEMSARPGYYFFSYLSYVLLCIMIMVLGPIMYTFYEKNVKMRTDCGLVSVRKQNIEIIKGIIFVAAVIWSLFMLVGAIVYRKDFTTEEYLLGVLNSFVLLLFSVAISVLLGVVFRNKNALDALSNILGLGISFLCGVFVPSEFMPDYVNKIAEFLPVSWYMKNVKMLNEYGNAPKNLSEFMGNCGLVLGFAAATFLVFLVYIKKQRPYKFS